MLFQDNTTSWVELESLVHNDDGAHHRRDLAAQIEACASALRAGHSHARVDVSDQSQASMAGDDVDTFLHRLESEEGITLDAGLRAFATECFVSGYVSSASSASSVMLILYELYEYDSASGNADSDIPALSSASDTPCGTDDESGSDDDSNVEAVVDGHETHGHPQACPVLKHTAQSPLGPLIEFLSDETRHWMIASVARVAA